MLTGAHVVIYSKDPETDRAFFQEVLQLPSIDAGGGWLIFGAPAAEIAFHPDKRNDRHELFLVCDKLKATITALKSKGVHFGEVAEERWGIRTTILLPGGGKLGLYEPKHPVTFSKARGTTKRKKPKRG